MSKLHILFPCSPLDGIRRVDEEFTSEMNAAVKAGFHVFFFDHDKLVKQGNVEFSEPVPTEGKMILRGWMLSLEQYEKLYAACGPTMVTDPYHYEHRHYWPKAYGQSQLLRSLSPRCCWTDSKEFSVKHIKQFFGGSPIMVKDHVKSAKGVEGATFIKNSSNKTEVFTVINKMIAERGSLFQRGIVMKEVVPVQKDKEGNTIEFRAFFYDGNIVTVESNGCTWDYLHAQMVPSSSLSDVVKKLAEGLGNGFFTVDLMLSDGKWMVIECGDGQVSGLAAKANPVLFYEKLRWHMKKDMPEEPEEHVLSDDFLVYWDYFYVADGKVVRSDIQGTVADLRRDLIKQGISAVEIRSCDIVTRAKLADA